MKQKQNILFYMEDDTSLTDKWTTLGLLDDVSKKNIQKYAEKLEEAVILLLTDDSFRGQGPQFAELIFPLIRNLEDENICPDIEYLYNDFKDWYVSNRETSESKKDSGLYLLNGYLEKCRAKNRN